MSPSAWLSSSSSHTIDTAGQATVEKGISQVPSLQHTFTAFGGLSPPRIAYYQSPDGRITLTARAAGHQVCILDAVARVPIQTLSHDAGPSSSSSPHQITCLRIKTASKTQDDGLHQQPPVLLAASSTNVLTIWSSLTPPSSRWSQHSTLTFPSNETITTFDLHADHLLVGSKSSLQLWKLDHVGHSNSWRKVWAKSTPAPLRDVVWNHSGNSFAAVAERDRRVIVWHKPTDKLPFRSGVLLHHDQVHEITWRGSPDPSSQTDVLVTRAADGAARIWAPVIDQPDQLRLSATIDAFSFGHQSSSPSPVFYLDSHRFATVLRSTISLLERDLQMSQLAIHEHATSASPDLLRTRLKRFQHLLADTPDVFLRLVDNGSTIVIRAVANIDRRPPTLLQAYTVLVLKMSAPLRVQDAVDRLDLIPMPPRPGQSIQESSAILHFTSQQGGSIDVDLSPALFFDGLETGVASRTDELIRGHARRVDSLWTTEESQILTVDCAYESVLWDVQASHSDNCFALKSMKRTKCKTAGIDVNEQLLYANGQASIFSTGKADDRRIYYCQDASPMIPLDLGKHKKIVTVLQVCQDPNGGITVQAVTKTGHHLEWHFSSDMLRQPAHIVPPVQLSVDIPLRGPSSHETRDDLLQACLAGAEISNEGLTYITLDRRGRIVIWKKAHDVKTNITKEMEYDPGNPSPSDEDSLLCHCSSQNTMAIVMENKSRLDIYSLPSSSFESGLQYSEASPENGDPIVGVDWLAVPGDAPSELLAVAHERSVRILARSRATPQSPGPLWATVANFNFVEATHSPLTGGKWTSAGGLLVIESGNVHLLGPFTAIGPESESHAVRLLDLAAKYQDALPPYHPTVIQAAVTSGRLQTVHRVVQELAKALDEAAMEERETVLASSLPSLTSKDLSSDDHSVRQAAKGSRVNGSAHSGLFEESRDTDERSDDTPKLNRESVSRIISQLEHIKLEHLGEEDVRQLITLLKPLVDTGPQSRSLDVLGYNYFVAIKQLYAVTSAPTTGTSLDHRYTISALHTATQDELVAAVQSSSPLKNSRIPWSLARRTNLFLWVPQSHLQSLTEQVARDQFQAGEVERDPVSCSLFYYALGNKRLVLNLWRQAAWHPEQRKMITFLEKDFSEERWRVAACKNAFALLSQRRFELAASFFMLGDSLQDAVNVCVRNLNDTQLAIALARIKEGRDDGPVLQKLIRERVLASAVETQDRYLAHWCLWMMGEKGKACDVLLKPIHTVIGSPAGTSGAIVAHPEDHTLPTIYPRIRSKTPRGSTSITLQHEMQFVEHANRTLQRIGCHAFGSALLREWQPTSDTDEHTAHQETQDSSSSFAQETPTSGPPEPGADDLLNMGGKSRGGISNTSSQRSQPTQGPPEPDLDDLMSMGAPKKNGTNGIAKGVPAVGPPEPQVDDLFNMGASSASSKQSCSTPPQRGEQTLSPADPSDDKPAEAEPVKDETDDPPKKKKGVGSLMKPTSNASQQGGQEFDMSSFGF